MSRPRWSDLRRAAEAQLAKRQQAPPASDLARDRLLHELLVMQTELEMQNDELRAAQIELTQSRDRYQQLYELAPVGYVTLDGRGRILEANSRAAELLGVGADEVAGRTLQWFMPQASADAFHHHLASVFATGQPQSCDVTFAPRSRGTTLDVPVHVESTARKDAVGEDAICHSALTNLSELRSAHERLHLAKFASGVGLWCWKPGKGRSTWDENATAMLGLEPGEVLDGDTLWSTLVHPDDRTAVVEQLYAATMSGAPFAARFRVVRRDRSVVHLAARGSPVRDADGRFVAMTGAFVDVTREELSSELSRIAVEATPNALLIVDRDGRIVLANDQASRLFGWPRADLVGASIDKLVPPDVQPHHADLREQFFAAPARRRIVARDDLHGLHRDGHQVPLEIALAPVRLASGIGVLAAIVDVTERRELQTKLSQAERLAAVGELAAGVAHEINNPINTVINCAQLIKDGDDAIANSDVILEEGNRISEIVKELLLFARADRSKPQAMSLAEVVGRTMRLFGESLRRHGIDLRTEIPDGLPAVLAHPQQIQQVLLNLLINSKAALQQRESGRDRAIVIRAAADEHTVRCSVWDNGPGIAPDLLPRVFQPFVTTKRGQGGTGLGLSVSRGIIESFGGRLDARSVPGEFCEFAFELPKAGSRAPQPQGDEPHGH